MIGYNPSHLNKNETLLEAFHRVEAYLKANPQYQVYQSSAQYQEGTQEYALNTIIVPEGSTVGAGDVVLFSNVYYAVITSVSETTFSIENATNFRGPQGPKGDRGTGGAGSNPNLLINPNFAINQRGQTSYTGAVYGVDRWKGYQLNTMVCTPNTNGVTLTAPTSATGTDTIYRQIIEPEQVARLAGKTITFSFMATNRGSASIYMRCLTPAAVGDTPNIASGETKIVTKTITLAGDITELQLVFRKGGGTLDVDINWVKLEIGSVATEFSPPSIAEELPKCQRYYQRYNFANNMPLPFGIARNEKTVSININIPKLRTTPTFATSGTVKLLNQNITGLTLKNNQYYDGVYRLFIETSGLSVGTGILIAGDTDGYYAFDAEI